MKSAAIGLLLTNEDVVSGGAVVPSDLHRRGPRNMAQTEEDVIVFSVAEEGGLNIYIFCASN